MAISLPLPAFSAFESQLKTLCLTEFPCGSGQWKEDHKRKKISLQKLQLGSKYSITLKDYGAQHEKTETLEELVTSKTSPWNLDYSWSDEAKQLREIAVRSPWLIDKRFVHNHFKTLRIVDKGVTDVDNNFLNFDNLEELTLSANYLRTVNSKHLPKNVKVLELCANQISNLADLCIQPPPLMHLGLGFNRLHMIEDYITGDYWPHLLSLDLSHNNLCDLMEIVRKLQSLPKLRNLTLQGNPLCLVPAYRGYTIDSIRRLDFLDDIAISADEKHHFKGLAKRKEYVLDEAKFIFKVDFLRGVPMPEELKNPDDQPEFPIVTKRYFLRFLFLKDHSSTNDLFHSMMQQEQEASVKSQHSEVNTARQSDVLGTERSSHAMTHVTGSQIGVEKNVAFAQAVATVHVAAVEDDQATVTQRSGELLDADSMADGHVPMDTSEGNILEKSTEDMEVTQDGAEEAKESLPLEVVAINSSMSEWAEEMELDWGQVVIRDNLLSLRDFLKGGIDVHVMEEKVLSFPAEADGGGTPTTDGKSPTKKEDKKKDSKPKKDGRKDSGRSKTPVKNDKAKPNKPKDDGKKKKKKGEPDVEMSSLPAEYTVITKFHIPTEDFIEGDFLFENLFRKNNEGENGFVTPASFYEVKKEDKKDKKKEGGKKEKGKKSPVPKKEKGGKDKDKKGAVDVEDDFVAPPPPLESRVRLGDLSGVVVTRSPPTSAASSIPMHRPTFGGTLAGDLLKVACLQCRNLDQLLCTGFFHKLTTSLSVELIQWKTAQDSLKTDYLEKEAEQDEM